MYGHISSSYCHVWTYLLQLLPCMDISPPVIAIYGHISSSYCHVWTYLLQLLPCMDVSPPVIAIYGHISSSYSHVWTLDISSSLCGSRKIETKSYYLVIH